MEFAFNIFTLRFLKKELEQKYSIYHQYKIQSTFLLYYSSIIVISLITLFTCFDIQDMIQLIIFIVYGLTQILFLILSYYKKGKIQLYIFLTSIIFTGIKIYYNDIAANLNYENPRSSEQQQQQLQLEFFFGMHYSLVLFQLLKRLQLWYLSSFIYALSKIGQIVSYQNPSTLNATLIVIITFFECLFLYEIQYSSRDDFREFRTLKMFAQDSCQFFNKMIDDKILIGRLDDDNNLQIQFANEASQRKFKIFSSLDFQQLLQSIELGEIQDGEINGVKKVWSLEELGCELNQNIYDVINKVLIQSQHQKGTIINFSQCKLKKKEDIFPTLFDINIFCGYWDNSVCVYITLKNKTEDFADDIKIANFLLKRMAKDTSGTINNIKDSVQTLQESVAGDQYKLLQSTLASATLLQKRLFDILDLADIKKGQLILDLKKINLKDMIQKVVQLIEPFAVGKGILLAYEIDQVIPKYIISDQERLEQILINLMQFSLKSVDRGCIRLKIEQNNLESNVIQISIVDVGHGLTHQEIQNIFIPIQQILFESFQPQNTKGSLNLSISQILVGMIGPKREIQIMSLAGKGKTFMFEIYIADDKMKQKNILFDYTNSELKVPDMSLQYSENYVIDVYSMTNDIIQIPKPKQKPHSDSNKKINEIKKSETRNRRGSVDGFALQNQIGAKIKQSSFRIKGKQLNLQNQQNIQLSSILSQSAIKTNKNSSSQEKQFSLNSPKNIPQENHVRESFIEKVFNFPNQKNDSNKFEFKKLAVFGTTPISNQQQIQTKNTLKQTSIKVDQYSAKQQPKPFNFLLIEEDLTQELIIKGTFKQFDGVIIHNISKLSDALDTIKTQQKLKTIKYNSLILGPSLNLQTKTDIKLQIDSMISNKEIPDIFVICINETIHQDTKLNVKFDKELVKPIQKIDILNILTELKTLNKTS